MAKYSRWSGYNEYRDQINDSCLWKSTTSNYWRMYVKFITSGSDYGRGGWRMDVEEPVDFENGIRPYIGGGKSSYVEQMRRTTDKAIFNELLQKQSEFKKPWANDEGYPEMEYWHPWMPIDPWFPWDFGDPPTVDPLDPDGPGSQGGLDDCALYIFGQTLWRECGKEYRIRPIYGRTFRQISLANGQYGASYIKKWNPEYAIIVAGKNDGAPNRVVEVLTVTYNDGSICRYDMLNYCKDEDIVETICPEDVTDTDLEWDSDNSATTMDTGASATVFITPGFGEHTWTVSGTGVFFDKAYSLTTMKKDETVSAVKLYTEVAACGGFKINVTDYCGNSTDGYVRCTNGQWISNGAVCSIDGMPDDESCSAPTQSGTNPRMFTMSYVHTNGLYRQTQSTQVTSYYQILASSCSWCTSQMATYACGIQSGTNAAENCIDPDHPNMNDSPEWCESTGYYYASIGDGGPCISIPPRPDPNPYGQKACDGAPMLWALDVGYACVKDNAGSPVMENFYWGC